MIGSFVDCWHLFLLPPRQCWHRENFAFGMLLKVRWRRRRRFHKGVELSIADLLPKTFLSFPEGRSSEIAKYAADVRTDCEKIARVQSTMYRPEVSRSAQTKKSTQLKVSFPSPKWRSPNHHWARAAREVVIWRPSTEPAWVWNFFSQPSGHIASCTLGRGQWGTACCGN